EAREDLAEDLHLEGVAVGPLHGRHPRVQPLRERDVGLPRRIVRPELLVHDPPAPFLDELPRRDHLPSGTLCLVHSCTIRRDTGFQFQGIAIPGSICRIVGRENCILPGSSWYSQTHSTSAALNRTVTVVFIEKRPPRHPGLGNQSRT